MPCWVKALLCLAPVLSSAVTKMDAVNAEDMNLTTFYHPFASHFPTTQSSWIRDYIPLIILISFPEVSLTTL